MPCRDVRTVAMALVLAASAPAVAHESSDHVAGVVARIDAAQLVVRASDGDEVTFALTTDTLFARGERPVRPADVQVGERVVVRGRRRAGVVEATFVELGPRPSPK